jgi:hypothetical protein
VSFFVDFISFPFLFLLSVFDSARRTPLMQCYTPQDSIKDYFVVDYNETSFRSDPIHDKKLDVSLSAVHAKGISDGGLNNTQPSCHEYHVSSFASCAPGFSDQSCLVMPLEWKPKMNIAAAGACMDVDDCSVDSSGAYGNSDEGEDSDSDSDGNDSSSWSVQSYEELRAGDGGRTKHLSLKEAILAAHRAQPPRQRPPDLGFLGDMHIPSPIWMRTKVEHAPPPTYLDKKYATRTKVIESLEFSRAYFSQFDTRKENNLRCNPSKHNAEAHGGLADHNGLDSSSSDEDDHAPSATAENEQGEEHAAASQTDGEMKALSQVRLGNSPTSKNRIKRTSRKTANSKRPPPKAKAQVKMSSQADAKRNKKGPAALKSGSDVSVRASASMAADGAATDSSCGRAALGGAPWPLPAVLNLDEMMSCTPSQQEMIRNETSLPSLPHCQVSPCVPQYLRLRPPPPLSSHNDEKAPSLDDVQRTLNEDAADSSSAAASAASEQVLAQQEMIRNDTSLPSLPHCQVSPFVPQYLRLRPLPPLSSHTDENTNAPSLDDVQRTLNEDAADSSSAAASAAAKQGDQHKQVYLSL